MLRLILGVMAGEAARSASNAVSFSPGNQPPTGLPSPSARVADAMMRPMSS